MLVNEDKQPLVGEVLPPEVANEGGDMTEQSDDDMLNGLGLGDDNNEVHNRIKETNFKKYGVENVSKLDFVKNKKKATCLKYR